VVSSISAARTVWDTAQTEVPDVFEGPGICESVTSDGCSDARVADVHRTWRRLRNALIRVTNEYDAVPPGATVAANTNFGTGNVTKAAAVQIRYTEAISNYKFSARGAALRVHGKGGTARPVQRATVDREVDGQRWTWLRPIGVRTSVTRS
jgi:hypothetical protein